MNDLVEISHTTACVSAKCASLVAGLRVLVQEQ